MNGKNNITLNIRFFAGLREKTGKESLLVGMPADACAEELTALVRNMHPEMSILLSNSRMARNSEFIDSNVRLHDGDEIAFIPPVSGG